MIVPMKVITLLCLETDKVDALNRLGGMALMHLKQTPLPSTDDVAALASSLRDAEQLFGIVQSAPEAKQPMEIKLSGDALVARGLELVQAKNVAVKERERLQRERDELLPWGNFDWAQIESLRNRGVHVALCMSAAAVFDAKMKNGAFPENAAVEVVARSKANVWYALVSQEPLNRDELDAAALPSDSLKTVEEKLAAAEKTVSECSLELSSMRSSLDDLKHVAAARRDRLDFAAARDGMAGVGRIALLSGYVPETRLEELKKAALEQGWALLVEEPDPDDPNVPTCIVKPKFLDILDPLFDFIGITPGYRERDVNLFFFIFFPIFFAMILGDAGYGALFIVSGVLCRWFFRKKPAAKLPCSLLVFLGIYTFIWGWMNGSWFGLSSALLPESMRGLKFFTDPEASPFARKFVAFYGMDPAALTEADWSGMTNKFTQYFCFLLAAFHLISAHLTRFFLELKSSWRAFAHLGWGLLIFANFLLAVSLIVFPGTFPAWGKFVYIAAVALIVVTIRGEAALNLPFDLVGSFTDVLSYIRLFAVGLSGMYIAEKFNEMGLMVLDPMRGGPWVWLGIIFLIFVVLAGHLMNLALGFLGVMVHAVRLNTLEFSNHMGLQWAGLLFKPFSIKQNENKNQTSIINQEN